MKQIFLTIYCLFCLVFCSKPIDVGKDQRPNHSNSSSDHDPFITEDQLLRAIGTKPIEDLARKLGDKYYRIIEVKNNLVGCIIYEVSNVNGTIQFERRNYSIDPGCNPISGSRKFESNCITVIDEYNKSISIEQWDSLSTVFKKAEFWELSEDQSPIHENSYECMVSYWIIEGLSTFRSPLADSTGLIEIVHRVRRNSINNFESVNHIVEYVITL
jgi:hypothetical protein